MYGLANNVFFICQHDTCRVCRQSLSHSAISETAQRVNTSMPAQPINNPMSASPIDNPMSAQTLNNHMSAQPIDNPMSAQPIDNPMSAQHVNIPLPDEELISRLSCTRRQTLSLIIKLLCVLMCFALILVVATLMDERKLASQLLLNESTSQPWLNVSISKVSRSRTEYKDCYEYPLHFVQARWLRG